MKKAIRSYLSFTRTERIGLLGVCGALVILVAIRATMHLWVHPAIDTGKEQKLTAAWETFKRSQPIHSAENTVQKHNDFEDAGNTDLPSLPDTININTADSATLVRLKGIGPVTAGKIIERRKNQGRFTNINQLAKLGRFSDATLELLRKHIVF